MLMIKISIVKLVESDTDSMGYTTKFTHLQARIIFADLIIRYYNYGTIPIIYYLGSKPIVI
jgi:hypothetical protein